MSNFRNKNDLIRLEKLINSSYPVAKCISNDELIEFKNLRVLGVKNLSRRAREVTFYDNLISAKGGK